VVLGVVTVIAGVARSSGAMGVLLGFRLLRDWPLSGL
jgi:hypothetical protein